MASYDASGVIRLDFGSAGEARNSFLYGNGVPAVATFGVRASALKLREHIGQGVIQFGFSANGYADNSTRKTTLTAKDVVGDVLRQWGMCCDNADSLDACIKSEALQAVNAAIQFIHANGKQLPYLTQRQRDYWFGIGIKAVDMETDVQHVEGAAHLVGRYKLEIPVSDAPGGSDGRAETPLNVGATELRIYPVGASVDSYKFIEITSGSTLDEIETLLNERSFFDSVYVDYRPDAVGAGGAGLYTLTIYFSGEDYPWMLWDDTTTTQMESTGGWIIGILTIEPFAGQIDATEVGQSTQVAPLESGFDARNYTALYGTDAPPAYWLERRNTGEADSSKMILHLVPVATDPTCLRIDVGVQAGRVEWNDVVAGTTIPIPHEYVESLLIPIARWYATSSKNYRQRERHEAIIEQYNQALAMLGMVDPKPAGQPAKDGDAK